ncbi:putative bifunctional dihydrofolate reductase-thymidylate synthase [Ananas comosus]|uniref:thymidylate synthase n=1 Tax=Ananas comosus TaxID=4615 RepID=A0A199VTF8_ANACO|nr:putative bifunctional dihydrofolate reductase-thymidylate synthase [Ananas comosus]
MHHKFEVEEFSFLPKWYWNGTRSSNILNLSKIFIANGARKNDRTLTGTLSNLVVRNNINASYIMPLRADAFNLRRYFPLLTTKRVFWRGVVEELLWFISGSTNAKVLEEKGIHIWESNAVGLKDREAGDLGPIYGFQWRHFGAEYTDMHADYTGKGFDQLSDVIDKIKNSPDDRRIILSAWNPSDLKKMALPPCHMFAQFYVENGELSCQMYQRSADMGLGVPFNIASYSLLTCMIAHVCGLSPGEFIHVIGDAHVYRNHVVPLEEQLARQPKPFPILKINPMKKDIDSFEASDFELIGYDPHYKVAMDLAV